MDLFPWSPRSQMSLVDILSFYISEHCNVVEDETAERERKEQRGKLCRSDRNTTQSTAEPPLHYFSLSLCGPPFTPSAPDKINRVSVINSLLSLCDCSSVMCVCVCIVQCDIAAYI